MTGSNGLASGFVLRGGWAVRNLKSRDVRQLQLRLRRTCDPRAPDGGGLGGGGGGGGGRILSTTVLEDDGLSCGGTSADMADPATANDPHCYCRTFKNGHGVTVTANGGG